MRSVARTSPWRGGLRNHGLLLRKRLSKHDGLGISFKEFGHFIPMWTVSSVVIITTDKTWELWFPLWFLFISRWWVLSFWLFIIISLFVFILCLFLTSSLLRGCRLNCIYLGDLGMRRGRGCGRTRSRRVSRSRCSSSRLGCRLSFDEPITPSACDEDEGLDGSISGMGSIWENSYKVPDCE
jgi:hypothetical protein